MNSTGSRWVMGCLGGIALSGCAVKRAGYEVPEVPLPAHYRNAPATPAAPAAETSADELPPEWWRAFGNAELNSLIDRGIANSPDLRIATLKLAQLAERAKQAGADKAPNVTANVGSSAQAPGGSVGSVPVTSDSEKTTQRLYQASLRGNWRLDIWGEQSALAQSANLQVWQAAFDRDNVQRNLVASLAANYVEYLALNDRLRIAQEAEVLLSGVLTTIEKRVAAEDATMVDLEQQKAAIFAVRATIPSLEQQRDDVLTNIAFLTGTLPGALSLSKNGLDSLTLPEVVPEQPSALIFRRPDVRTQEAKLLAADADIDVARARLLPPLDLTAQMGYSSLVLSGLFKPIGFFWNTIANMTASVFDNGKLSSLEQQARATHEEMVETYARTLHQAVREVERALSLIRTTAKRQEIQQQATAAAQRAWDISNEIYAAGGLEHQTLLDAGRTYLRHLDDYQSVRMERHRAAISLFQALGGGANLAQAIPGSTTKPTVLRTHFAATKAGSTAPVASTDWPAGQAMESGKEVFWQVELTGLYPRAAIAPAWRDLRTRYPKLMEGRIVRTRREGGNSDASGAPTAMYRLYVVRFDTPSAAEEMCTALKAASQRCRVISSISDETVPSTTTETTVAPIPTPPPATPAETTPAAPPAAPEAKPVEAPVPSPTPLSTEPSKPRKEAVAYAIQLGVFSSIENANKAKAEWQERGYESSITEVRDAGGTLRHAVRSGSYRQRSDAFVVAAKIKLKEGMPIVIVPVMVPVAAPVKEEKPAAPPRSEKPSHQEKGRFSVQLGAFAELSNAQRLVAQWQQRGYAMTLCEVRDNAQRTRYIVRTGGFARREDADVLAYTLKQIGAEQAVRVPALSEAACKAPTTHAEEPELPAAETASSAEPAHE